MLDLCGRLDSSKMSDGTVLKADKDYTKEADKQIPEAEELAKVNAPHSSTRSHVLTYADKYSGRHRQASDP